MGFFASMTILIRDIRVPSPTVLTYIAMLADLCSVDLVCAATSKYGPREWGRLALGQLACAVASAAMITLLFLAH